MYHCFTWSRHVLSVSMHTDWSYTRCLSPFNPAMFGPCNHVLFVAATSIQPAMSQVMDKQRWIVFWGNEVACARINLNMFTDESLSLWWEHARHNFTVVVLAGLTLSMSLGQSCFKTLDARPTLITAFLVLRELHILCRLAYIVPWLSASKLLFEHSYGSWALTKVDCCLIK